jgi:hypothetical protein
MDSAATPATPATATENTQLTLAIRVKQEFSKTDSPSKKLVYSPLAGECGYKGPEELRKHSTSRAQPEAQQKALERQDGHSADEWGLSSVKNTTGPTNLVRLERLEVRGPRKRKDEERTYDPKWEGRKNFKKFRRQGKGPGADAGRVRMIIPLVEYVASRRLEGAKSAGSPQPSTSHWPASPSADSSRYVYLGTLSIGNILT